MKLHLQNQEDCVHRTILYITIHHHKPYTYKKKNIYNKSSYLIEHCWFFELTRIYLFITNKNRPL